MLQLKWKYFILIGGLHFSCRGLRRMRPYPDLRGHRGRGGAMGMGPPPPPPPMHLRGPFPPRYTPNSPPGFCFVCAVEPHHLLTEPLFCTCDFRFFRSLALSELDVSHSAELTCVSLQRFSSDLKCICVCRHGPPPPPPPGHPGFRGCPPHPRGCGMPPPRPPRHFHPRGPRG